MKKRYLLTGLLAGLMVVSATSCNGFVSPSVDESQTAKPTETTKPTEEVKLETITFTGGKTSFNQGDAFDKGDLKVTAHYSDGTFRDVTSDAKVETDADMSKPGTYKVTVSYAGRAIQYNISVNAVNVKTLKAIELDTQAVKKEFEQFEAFTAEGLKVILVYSNTEPAGDTEEALDDISKATVTLKNPAGEVVTDGKLDVAGEYTVSVTYEDKSSEYKITANEANVKTLKGIEVEGAKAVFNQLDTFTSEGLKAFLVYSNTVPAGDTKEELKDLSKLKLELKDPSGKVVTDNKLLSYGEYTVTATYENFTASYKIMVNQINIKTLKALEISEKVIAFEAGSDFSLAGVKLNLVYSNTMPEGDTTEALEGLDGVTYEIRNSNDQVLEGTKLLEPGEYNVIIKYKDLEAEYTINVMTLKGIKVLDNSGRRLFALNEAFDSSRVAVYKVYRDVVNDKDVMVLVEDSNALEFSVADANGNAIVDNKLAKLGSYTVTVKLGTNKTTYTISAGASIKEAIDKALASAGKVNELSYEDKVNELVNGITFGNGFTLVTTDGVRFDEDFMEYPVQENTYYFMHEGEIKGYVEALEKGTNRSVDINLVEPENENVLLGVPNFNITGDYDNPLYTPEDVLSALYELALANEFHDFTEKGIGEADSNGVYASYNVTFSATVAETYMLYDFTFGLDPETGILKDLSVSQVGYATKEEVGDPKNIIYNFEYVWHQTAGERAAELPYAYDSFFATSFDLLNLGEKITSDTIIEYDLSSDPLEINIDNVLPATANFSIDTISVTTPASGYGEYANLGYNIATGRLELTANKVTGIDELTGEQIYETFVVETKNTSYTFKVKVVVTPPTYIEAQYYSQLDGQQTPDDDTDDYWDWQTAKSYQIKPNESLKIRGVAEFGKDGRYKAELLSQGATITEEYEYDYMGNEVLIYNFTTATEGRYVVKFTSLANPEVTTNFTIVVSSKDKKPLVDLPYNLADTTWVDENGNSLVFGSNSLNWFEQDYGIVEFVEDESFTAELFGVELKGVLTVDPDTFDITNIALTNENGVTFNLTKKAPFDINLYGTYLDAEGNELIIKASDYTTDNVIILGMDEIIIVDWDKTTIYGNNAGAPCTFTIGTGSIEYNGVVYTLSYEFNIMWVGSYANEANESIQILANEDGSFSVVLAGETCAIESFTDSTITFATSAGSKTLSFDESMNIVYEGVTYTYVY